MSTTVVGGVPPQTKDGRESGRHEQRRFGLPAATALVAGSVVGSGVVALPSALSRLRPN
jgi:APA family basic amino acid/polyamine antiporter